MAVARVTARATFPRAQAPPGLAPIVLAEGTPEELENLDILDSLYDEGDLGELQFFLQDQANDMRTEVEESLDELEEDLIGRGALPWPGATRITSIDWSTRTVTMRFQQGVAFLIVLAMVMMTLISAALTFSIIIAGLESFGIDVPDTIENIADAAGLIAAISAAIWVLGAFLPIPIGLLIGGGLLVFTLLRPDLAWRAIKWVGEQALDLLDKLGVHVPELAMAAGAGIFGVLMLTMGMKQALRG